MRAERHPFGPQPRRRPGRNLGWMRGEDGLAAAGREAVRLLRRAAHQPVKTLLLALMLGALVTAGLLLRKREFSPTFVLRVVEMDQDTRSAPRAKKKLREHVEQAVFTHTRLLEIIDRHGLYRNLRKKDPRAAVVSFQEDIEVEVYRNYFVQDRTAHGAPRSARITVSYRSEDPDEALRVTRDLGALIAESESAIRRQQLENAASGAAIETRRASDDLVALRQRLSKTFRDWATASGSEDSAKLSIELMELRASIEHAERRLQAIERTKADLDLAATMAEDHMALRFEVVDRGAISASERDRRRHAYVAGFTTFFMALPLMAVAVGAFDSRIRYADDLTRLGLSPFGLIDPTMKRTRGYA